MTAIMASAPVRAPSRRLAATRVAATNAVAERFFAEHADAIARACHAMAERFQGGGRLLVCGDGAQRSDVAHVVVEFVHPVVVGKRALPALPLPSVHDGAAQRALAALGRRGDMLLVLAAAPLDGSAHAVLAEARTRGLLTLAFAGGDAPLGLHADHLLVVSSDDPCIVQETQEMLYHVLWELVHVFFDYRAVSA